MLSFWVHHFVYHVSSSGNHAINSSMAFFLIFSTLSRFFFPVLMILFSVYRLANRTSLRSSPCVPGTRFNFLCVTFYLVASAAHWSKMCLAVSSNSPQCLQVLVFARWRASLSPLRLLAPDLSLNICLMASVSRGLRVM